MYAIRSYYEVDPEGNPVPRPLKFIDRRLDLLEGETGGAEEAEHSGLAQGAGHGDGTDPLGHGPADIGVAQGVVATEA